MIVAKLVKIKKFELENESIKKLKKDEVLVKVSSSAICGSDLHYFRHGALGSQKPNFPLSLGHETCGVIVDKNNTNFKNYQNIVIDPLNVSKCEHKEKNIIGKCGFKKNLCPHQQYLGSSPTPGSFREYIPIHKDQITVLNNQIDIKYGSMVEPTGIAQFSIERANINFKKENKILILGSGAIGLLISSISKIHAGVEVTIIDCLQYRLISAKKNFKSDFIINSNLKNPKENLFNKFDVVFDCVTNDDSIDLSIQALKKSGKLVVVGIPTSDFLKINPHKIRIKEIDIINVRRSKIDFQNTVNLIIKNKIPINKLITHSFSLKNIQKAFNIASKYSDKIIRGIIT